MHLLDYINNFVNDTGGPSYPDEVIEKFSDVDGFTQDDGITLGYTLQATDTLATVLNGKPWGVIDGNDKTLLYRAGFSQPFIAQLSGRYDKNPLHQRATALTNLFFNNDPKLTVDRSAILNEFSRQGPDAMPYLVHEALYTLKEYQYDPSGHTPTPTKINPKSDKEMIGRALQVIQSVSNNSSDIISFLETVINTDTYFFNTKILALHTLCRCLHIEKYVL